MRSSFGLNFQETIFEESIPMSTYLIAILISDFNFFSDFESVPFCYYEQNLAQYYKSKRQNLRTTLKT